jgi:hypothetical protein
MIELLCSPCTNELAGLDKLLFCSMLLSRVFKLFQYAEGWSLAQQNSMPRVSRNLSLSLGPRVMPLSITCHAITQPGQGESHLTTTRGRFLSRQHLLVTQGCCGFTAAQLLRLASQFGPKEQLLAKIHKVKDEPFIHFFYLAVLQTRMLGTPCHSVTSFQATTGSSRISVTCKAFL